MKYAYDVKDEDESDFEADEDICIDFSFPNLIFGCTLQESTTKTRDY
jgi:hypothetical protein